MREGFRNRGCPVVCDGGHAPTLSQKARKGRAPSKVVIWEGPDPLHITQRDAISGEGFGTSSGIPRLPNPGKHGPPANPFQYTGRDFDSETGLRYYRARYYDQNVGRFLSEDPGETAPHDLCIAMSPTIRWSMLIQPGGTASTTTAIMFEYLMTKAIWSSKCRGTTGKPGTTPAQQSDAWSGPIPKGRYLMYPEELAVVRGSNDNPRFLRELGHLANSIASSTRLGEYVWSRRFLLPWR